MNSVSIAHFSKKIKANISLPSSKSVSNRALILLALNRNEIELKNISNADDTMIMLEALKHQSKIIYVKNAGTCMRFLTAYFSCINGEVELRGDERMNSRPIKILVDALRKLGAEISYLGEEGFPPLKIIGRQLEGGNVLMDAGVSSQYVTALMLVAPTFKNGLIIELSGEISSLSYIRMTMDLMKKFGFEISFIENRIVVGTDQSDQQINSTTQQLTYTIEPDWSAASYWYEIAALSDEAEILLSGLSEKSLQGDAVIAEYMKSFGVETVYTGEGVVVRKNNYNTSTELKVAEEDKTFNLLNTPDLAPTMAVTAAVKNMETVLSGLQNLIIKESDRLSAIETELKKCGFDIVAKNNSLIIHKISDPQILTVNTKHQTSNIKPASTPKGSEMAGTLDTYQDHRLAMCFAPLALAFNEIIIEQPEVVKKSYPHFWEDLKRAGFEVSIR